MKKFLSVVAILFATFSVFGIPNCICTTNWVHLVMLGAPPAWTPASGPVVLQNITFLWINCPCKILGLVEPKTFGIPMEPTPTPTNLPPIGPAISVPNENISSIVFMQVMDPYAVSNHMASPYFQTQTSLSVLTSTNLTDWEPTYRVDLMSGLGTMAWCISSNGVPMLTNSVTSDNYTFNGQVPITLPLGQGRGFFRVRTP